MIVGRKKKKQICPRCGKGTGGATLINFEGTHFVMVRCSDSVCHHAEFASGSDKAWARWHGDSNQTARAGFISSPSHMKFEPLTSAESKPADPHPASAAEILNSAQGHMQDRAATYDQEDGERSIGKTVRAFNTITGDGLMNTEERGWLFMMLLKAVRAQSGELRMDSYEDGAAYFALAGEAAAVERAEADNIPDFLKQQAE